MRWLVHQDNYVVLGGFFVVWVTGRAEVERFGSLGVGKFRSSEIRMERFERGVMAKCYQESGLNQEVPLGLLAIVSGLELETLWQMAPPCTGSILPNG
jgi:hypothetical protein